MTYRPGDTFLHRTDPRAKVGCLLVVLALALTTTRLDVLAVLLAVVAAALWAMAAIAPWSYARALAVIVPLIVLLTLLQALVQPGPVLATVAGVALSRPGVLLGLGIGLRLLVMGIAFHGFSVTTSPSAVSLAVHKAGIPYRFAYLASFAFRFLPLLQDEARTLLTAMSLRASPDAYGANPVPRVRGLLRLVFPMLVGALRRSGDIALSMELRGYGLRGARTFTRPLRFRASDGVLLAGAVALVAIRIWGFS